MILIYSQCYPPMCPNVAGNGKFTSNGSVICPTNYCKPPFRSGIFQSATFGYRRRNPCFAACFCNRNHHGQLGIDMAKSSNFKGVCASTTGRSPCPRRCLKVGIIPLEKLGFFEMILVLSHLEYG